MIRIEKIPLNKLQNFINSNLFLNFKNKPISLLRAKSYINNPNAKPTDINLYLAFINNELVAFRTLFADYFLINNTKQKFYWLSGSWTHENYRRKGIATKLLNEIHVDCNDRIIFANYAPNSKALYDKTNIYTKLKTLDGYRFYRRISFAEILKHRNSFFKNIKFLLKITDAFLNFFLDFRFKDDIENKNFKIEKIKKWNNKTITFLNGFKENELFQRNAKTYQWIKDNPWIKNDIISKKFAKNYQFSTYTKVYENNFYCISCKETNDVIALINISIKNATMKIPYLYMLPKHKKTVSNLVLNLCKKHHIDFITVFNKNLNEILINEKQFLKYKKFTQSFYISKSFFKLFKSIKNKVIQTGDGDGVFT